MADRKMDGTFAEGISGNRRGRPRKKPVRLETTADLDELIIEVMNGPTKVRIGSEERDISIFEANVWALASGKAENRLAADRTIRLMRWALSNREQRERRRFGSVE